MHRKHVNSFSKISDISSFPVFHLCVLSNDSLSLCHLLLDGQKSGAHKMNVATSPSTTFLICSTLLFGTETPEQRCQKEGSLLSADNDADELKIKLWAHWNNNVNWAAQKDFIQTCQLPVVQGGIELGRFFLSLPCIGSLQCSRLVRSCRQDWL